MGLQKGGRRFTWRWESKGLVNKCLLGQQRQWGTERTFNTLTVLGSSLPAQLLRTVMVCGDVSFLEPALHPRSLGSYGKVKGSSCIFWALIVFKFSNIPHAEETFLGGKFCFPIEIIDEYTGMATLGYKLLGC